jgi:hypothetical protein
MKVFDRVRGGRARAAALLTAAVLIGVTAAAPTALAGTAGGDARAGQNGGTLFQDYFTTTPDTAWTFVNRGGQIAQGRLVIDGSYLPGATDRDGLAVTHVGDRAWRDYTFSATYDTENVGGGQPGVHMAFFFFRVMDSTPGAGTFYRLSVWDPGQESPKGSGGLLPDGLLQLDRYNAGVVTSLADVEHVTTVTGGNAVEIRMTGARIEVRTNGVLVASVRDPAPLRYGGVGVGQIWETNGTFDDVRVVRH